MSDATPDLSAYLGGDRGPYRSWDAVNRPMIRHWCEALGDDNPIYHDADAARAAGFDGIVAPPTMLQAWTMRGYREARPPGSDTSDPFEVLVALEELGYPAVVAVNCEQEYTQYVGEGDTLYHRSTIESISEQKSTALGVGFFVTELSTYYNQRDEVVGTMRFRVFKFAPHARDEAAAPVEAGSAPPAVRRMRPVRNEDTRFFWEGVEAGELRVQRCGGCQTLRHPPSSACPHCQSLEWTPQRVSGRGTVYSFVTMHYPEIPPFDYPNLIALVELEEGTRLVSNLVGVSRHDVRIGMPVQVEFAEVEPGFQLHQFRPLEGC
ncbi:bifunctional MaoC family dehydratase N-terminal/OB-fold nucleic acid binding domain-containing protein [Parahaliea mediterranea]|uniref:bifunctional MaoC family dehydratase N-terminal/OB-fold nucleic acid binding domain-containing protein n=1 Tax=Parahaliea mediterranea TaxID=651086 RepID=UPI0019D491A7|nr:bifunctional MaoC family dehydratase N-terminal/OB-fold nucleic acid binding domain-containing protein [Parahaliea mediterranea]